jgi:signal transduction histidine kinase
MRRARWVWCAISGWLLCAAGALAQEAGVQRLTQAQMQVVRLAPGESADHRQPDPAGPWQSVTLPLSREPPALIAPGHGSYLVWLKLRVRPRYDGASALHVTRADIGDVFARVGGQRFDDGHWQRSPRWNGPLLFVVPAGVLRADVDNEIMFALRTPAEQLRFGAVEIGPHAGRVLDHYQQRLFLAETLPRIATVLHLALAVFGLAVWWRRRAETHYLVLALNMLASAAFMLPFYYYPPVPFEPFGLYWNVTAAALAWVVTLNYVLAARLVGAPRSTFERVLLGYAISSSAVTTTLGWVDSVWMFPLYRLTVFQLPALMGLAVVAATLRLAWCTRTREAVAIAAGFVVQCGLGVHDALALHGVWPVDEPVLVPFSALVIMLTFGYSVLRRYVGSLSAAEQSASALDRQLAERTRELEASHARLREVEREHALAEERQRLMREMHDGMGSALTGSLLLVERGRLDSQAVARVLRETIDELKLTVDSLEPLGGDLVPLLATLRYRLGQRLEDAGLAIRWNVGDLPALPWLDAAASLHVLRVLQEAFANVARHSQADTVGLETECDARWVSVRIVDNGRGFDVEHAAAAGRGLRNMMRRMETLGGELLVASRPGETVLTIRLPRERPHGAGV